MILSLSKAIKCAQTQDVAFRQHAVLIPITAVFRKGETKLKGDTEGTLLGLFLRVSLKIRLKTLLIRLGINFALYVYKRGLWGFPITGCVETKFFEENSVMDESNLEDKLNELVKEFGETANPQHTKLAKLAKQAQANRKKLEKSINSLQESLDYLRVCIKYQVFDLEATRRENTYLRKLLEDNNQ